jgi:hypothetical protein
LKKGTHNIRSSFVGHQQEEEHHIIGTPVDVVKADTSLVFQNLGILNAEIVRPNNPTPAPKPKFSTKTYTLPELEDKPAPSAEGAPAPGPRQRGLTENQRVRASVFIQKVKKQQEEPKLDEGKTEVAVAAKENVQVVEKKSGQAEKAKKQRFEPKPPKPTISFGIDLMQLMHRDGHSVPKFVQLCLSYIGQFGINEEGIFR